MSQKVSALPVGVPKVKFSFKNHVLPPLVGIMVTLSIYGLLNLSYYKPRLEYYLAHFQPTHSTAAPAAISPNLSEVIIPSIGVKAPVIYEPTANNINIAYNLRSGVVHYATTALPGQKGNVVIFGHSSGVAWAPGNYKFVFTLLEKLRPGQQISIYYKGVQYVYVVTDSQVVAPTDMKILNSDVSKSELSLVTCTPVGTSKNRLVVHALQTRPDPVNNAAFQPTKPSDSPVGLPGD